LAYAPFEVGPAFFERRELIDVAFFYITIRLDDYAHASPKVWYVFF
jgi:hypothetical protein